MLEAKIDDDDEVEAQVDNREDEQTAEPVNNDEDDEVDEPNNADEIGDAPPTIVKVLYYLISVVMSRRQPLRQHQQLKLKELTKWRMKSWSESESVFVFVEP